MESDLLDYGDYPRIDCAAMADWHMLPDGRVRFILFDWEMNCGVWRRRVAGTVTRMTNSLQEDYQRFWREFGEIATIN